MASTTRSVTSNVTTGAGASSDPVLRAPTGSAVRGPQSTTSVSASTTVTTTRDTAGATVGATVGGTAGGTAEDTAEDTAGAAATAGAIEAALDLVQMRKFIVYWGCFVVVEVRRLFLIFLEIKIVFRVFRTDVFHLSIFSLWEYSGPPLQQSPMANWKSGQGDASMIHCAPSVRTATTLHHQCSPNATGLHV